MLEGALLVALGVCVVIQTLNKRIGAVITTLWCGALLFYGYVLFDDGKTLTFFGIRVHDWAFFAVMGALMLYYGLMSLRTPKASVPTATASNVEALEADRGVEPGLS